MSVFALVAWLFYDYFTDLRVTSAHVVGVTHDPAKLDLREIQIEVRSTRSELSAVPARLRQFFWLTPRLCFLTPAGTELINDDSQSPCTFEATNPQDRAKSHHNEISRFSVPVYLRAGPMNPEQRFLKNLRQNQGMWLRFELLGYMFPPTVTAKPVFLDVAAFCAAHKDVCKGLLEP